MNSRNTCDKRHFVATTIICVLVIVACAIIAFACRDSAEPRDVYTRLFTAGFAMFLTIEWVFYLLIGEKNNFLVVATGWWEHLWLRFVGRLSPDGARHLIATGKVRHCGFAWRDHGDAKVVPPESDDHP